MATFAQLQKKAASLGYTASDDKSLTTIEVFAPEGKAWEDGALTSIIEVYGNGGSYLKEWRQTAINDMWKRLDEYPPEHLSDIEED